MLPQPGVWYMVNTRTSPSKSNTTAMNKDYSAVLRGTTEGSLHSHKTQCDVCSRPREGLLLSSLIHSLLLQRYSSAQLDQIAVHHCSRTSMDPTNSVPYACGLLALPPNVLLILFSKVVAVSNTGQLVRLAMACKHCLSLVANADWFWQCQCQQLGWLRPGVAHPPPASPPDSSTQALHCHYSHSRTQQAEQQQQQQQPPAPAELLFDPRHLWFQYYTLRMSSRWRLRTLMRKYMPFLNVHCRLAVQPGISVQQLEATEARLGSKLPWELWELYRFKGGQCPGQAVSFTDGCRLLELPELYCVTIEQGTLPSLAPAPQGLQLEQQLAAVESHLSSSTVLAEQQGHGSQHPVRTASDMPGTVLQQPPVLVQHGHHVLSSSNSREAQQQADGQAATAQALQPAAGAKVQAVAFLANTMGSTCYAVSPDAAVHIVRGFTQRRVSASLSGFLQRLLT